MDNGSNFKNWFDAIWLGDEEHGQFIPNQKDEDYAEYLEQYTLAHGAYKYAISHSKERIAELEKDAVSLRQIATMAKIQITAWWGKYGENNPNWLPPANDVYLMEAIDEAMKGSNDGK